VTARYASATRLAAPAVDRIFSCHCKREAEEGARGQNGQQKTTVGKGQSGEWFAARNQVDP
jgi:hypothetical protein